MKANTTTVTSSSVTTDDILNSLYTIDTSSNSSNTYTTATSNCINSTPSITWTTSTPSIAYGSGSSNYNGYLNGIYGYFDDKLKVLISVLKETEVEELLDKLIERSDDTDSVKLIIKNIISQRHFSEDFLLKYYDYVDESTVKVQHDADIKSQEYSRLALLIEASK